MIRGIWYNVSVNIIDLGVLPMKKVAISLFMTLLGTALVAFSINFVSLPNELGDGGITGLTLFFHYVFNMNIPITAFILNVIVLVVGWKLLDTKTILYTLVSIGALSFFLAYIKPPVFLPENKLIAPIVTGVIMGSGLGIVIRGGGSTGGTDVIALIINKYFGISVSNALLMCDGIIVFLLFIAIGIERGVITIIGILICSRILNFWITGYNPKHAIMIITDHYEEVGQAVMSQVKRGVTILNGKGFYSRNDKQILYIVVSMRQLFAVEKIIHQIDPKAFVAVNAVQQVDGEGFTFNREENDAIMEAMIKEDA